MGCLAQAQSAEAELAVVGARTPALTAAVVAAALVLGLALLLDDARCLCHLFLTRSLLGCFVAGLGLGRLAGLGLLALFALFLALGLGVCLGVLGLQLLESGGLGLGALAGLLLAALLLGVLFLIGQSAGAPLLREGHAERQQKLEGLLVGWRGRGDGHVKAASLVDRVVVDLGEDQLLANAHRVVAPAVERPGVEASEVANSRYGDGDQAVEELPHAGAAQSDGDPHGHAVAHLEVRDRLARTADVGVLAGDDRQLLRRSLEHRRRLLGVADSHFERDLLQRRHPHPARVAEPGRELLDDLALVALAKTRRRSRLLRVWGCGRCFHQLLTRSSFLCACRSAPDCRPRRARRRGSACCRWDPGPSRWRRGLGPPSR